MQGVTPYAGRTERMPAATPRNRHARESLATRLLLLILVGIVHAVVLAWLFEHAPKESKTDEPPPMLVQLLAPPAPHAVTQPPARATAPSERHIQPPAPPPKPPHRPPPRPPEPAVRTAPRPTLQSLPPPPATTNTEDIRPAEAIAQAPAPKSVVPLDGERATAQPSTNTTRNKAPVETPARFDAAYLRNPPPRYPPLARRLGEQGRILLRVKVDADGNPGTVEVIESSGSPRLDTAAQQTVTNWRFTPAMRGTTPIDSWVQVPIVFKLEN